MSKPTRVLLLTHPDFRPDRGATRGTESDVWNSLRKMGAIVDVLPLRGSLEDLDKKLASFNPDVAFNLLEEFRDEGVFDFHPALYLEARGVPCTGCNPRGLILSRNKLWMMHIARGLGVATPDTWLPESREIRYPAFVKFNREHASLGITALNRVTTPLQLDRALRRMRARLNAELIVQEFVPGEEVSVAVFGNRTARALPPWQLRLGSANLIATEKIKFSAKLRQKHSIRAARYVGPAAAKVQRSARRLYDSLDFNGYARFDFRVQNGKPFLIDINVNPNLARDEDFARSARLAGFSYERLLSHIIKMARDYSPRI